MSFWDVDICNDPYNDYDLVYELLFLGYGFLNIEQTKNGLILILFDHSLSLPIPLDWMLKVMLDAKKNLPAGKVENHVSKNLRVEVFEGDDGRFLLYKNEKKFSSIIQEKRGLFLVVWRKEKNIFVSFDWLLNVIKRSKEELPAGRIENMDE